MIQIAICDDSEITLQHLNQSVNTILKSNQEAAAITLYSSSESLSYDIEEGHFFDLILTDIEMPHMNGMELATTIRTYLPGALIIFITAYTKQTHIFPYDIIQINKTFSKTSVLKAKVAIGLLFRYSLIS